MASVDMSLDDIIKSKPKGGARKGNTGRRTVRNQLLGKTNASDAKNRAAQSAKVAAATAPKRGQAVINTTEKIIVSNLPLDVKESDVKELFTMSIGPLRSAHLQYNAQGQSVGIATVTFVKQGDATRAFKDYNNRLIDGKRPMRIELVATPAGPSLTSRVAPLTNKGTRQPNKGAPVKKQAPKKKRAAPKSAADLDAEMEDYTASGTA